jgi:hypothetical protein
MNREQFIEELEKNQDNDLAIVKKKNSDYAADTDPFQNFRGVEHWGITDAETGILVRLSDKMQRVCNLIDREAQVEDESIIDTLSDARNYLNILQVYLEHEKEKEVKNTSGRAFYGLEIGEPSLERKIYFYCDDEEVNSITASEKYSDEEIVEKAYAIINRHKDFFDSFVYKGTTYE